MSDLTSQAMGEAGAEPRRRALSFPMHHASSRKPWTGRRRVHARALLAIATVAATLVSSVHAAPGPLRAEGRIGLLGVGRFDADSPNQSPELRVDLDVAQKVSPRVRWQAGLVARAGGPPRDPGGGVFDLGASFQNLAPSLEIGETWLSLRDHGVEVKAGLQKFYWGRLDGSRPNDLLNPHDFEDPALDEDRERKIAVPALAIDWTVPRSAAVPDASRLTLVWQPFDVPWRYPLPAERWFAPAARAPAELAVGAIADTPCPCDVSVTQRARNTAPPARNGGSGNYGIRFGARGAGIDWAAVVFDGYDPMPSFAVPVRLDGLGGAANARRAAALAPQVRERNGGTAPGLAPSADMEAAAFPLEATTDIVPAYRRFASFGGDAATEIFEWTVRGETALQLGRPFPFSLAEVTRRLLADPTAIARLGAGETVTRNAFAERDAIAWGIGADTFFGPWMPLIELTQVALLDNDAHLLVPDIDTRLTARLARTLLDETVDVELMATQAFEQGAGLTRARVGWAFARGARIEAGLIAIWGRAASPIGQYHDNDEVYARLQWAF